MDNDTIDAESLRLLKAFLSLRDPEVRGIILKLVEDTASGSKPAVQLTVDLALAKHN